MAPAGRLGFEPVHEAHAIEQLTAVVNFDRPLADAEMLAANQVMAKFDSALPGRSEIRGVGFQFGPLGVMPIATSPGSDAPNGLVRTYIDPRGVALKELRLERQSVLFRTSSYTRWDKVWGEAREYFSELLPVFGEACISAYSLVYTDKFIWRGGGAVGRPAEILRQNSPYVSPGVFDATDLWHCHSGRFIASENGAKRLEVVDLDCIDEMEIITSGPRPVRVVRISTNLTDQLAHPDSTAKQLPAAGGVGDLDQAFITFHKRLKDIFESIVTDEVAIKVGMKNAS